MPPTITGLRLRPHLLKLVYFHRPAESCQDFSENSDIIIRLFDNIEGLGYCKLWEL